LRGGPPLVTLGRGLGDVSAAGGVCTGTIPTTTSDCSCAVDREAGAEAVLLAMLDTAVGAEFDDAPRPADPDFAWVPA